MRTIECGMERLSGNHEEAWILSVPMQKVNEIIAVLAALHLGKINAVDFADGGAGIRLERRRDTKECGFMLSLGKRTISVTQTWMEAVAAVLVDAVLYGWNNALHIDQDFECGQDTVTVCVRVEASEH